MPLRTSLVLIGVWNSGRVQNLIVLEPVLMLRSISLQEFLPHIFD